MAEDEELKGKLASSCATKSKEWNERSKLSAQETEAINETIEMLNGDDALELFKKTLPWASFIQLATTTRILQRRTKKNLRRMRSNDPKHSMNLRAILLGLKSGSCGGVLAK